MRDDVKVISFISVGYVLSKKSPKTEIQFSN